MGVRVVTVFGGTGFLGRRVVRHLRKHEFSVRIASRHPERSRGGLRRRSPDRHGRGVDYSIALVERLSAFFIMLIGFEWVRPRLAPGT
jgi:uncharacterized protein YbjT (DUF2867 family)